MRPLKLQLKGFTAFRDPAELDFTDLDVFAIAGPTGSGKSSVLDAITYALYGRVERVGDRVGQLISHGQPRMAVKLEFEVGRDRYRVTRSTPAGRGGTKILLERQNSDSEWIQAGEGADRVREAEPMIVRAVGLTYDGFTRSVLLPQGRFAEFLVGDPKKRRDILTELLGLSLFRRMAERAGSITKECADRARWTNDMLEREFADATPEALRGARAEAKKAEGREQALAGAAERVVEIMGRWEATKRSIEDLRSCAAEAWTAARHAEAAAGELAALAERETAAIASLERLSAESSAARAAMDAATETLREAEASVGTQELLSEAQLSAHRFAEATRARQAGELEETRFATAAAALEEAVREAEASLAKSRETLRVRESEEDSAQADLEDARHGDLVAAVSAGLKAGDPCPVCGVPLRDAPKSAAAGGLGKAERADRSARKAVEAARADLSAAERTLDRAHLDLETNRAERERLAARIEGLSAAISEAGEELEGVLGAPIPSDPAAAIDGRLAKLRQLDRVQREATGSASDAAQSLLRAEQERERVASLIERQRDRLAVDHQTLFDRAARAAGTRLPPARLPDPPDAGDAGLMARYAEETAVALTDYARRLGNEVDERASIEERLLREAHEHVAGMVEPARSLEELATSVNAACREATADVATTAQRATDLAARVKRKKQLSGEARLLEDRAQLFRALALELRADRLVAFLQAEALQLLAAAASVRLGSFSDGRYRIVCREDEFFVVDTWNGDEERSARTLSGGETFLASLALALALSEQVRSLSVTDRARLDSLFLDEGFGTLDPESLRIVVEAIEQLGGDGRLVGVVTHVRELAEQFARIEVTKSPRGSRIAFVG